MKKVILLVTTYLLTGNTVSLQLNITNYDPAELLSQIFNPNITTEARQRGYGFVKFEDQPDPGTGLGGEDQGQYGLINFGESNTPLRFEDDNNDQYDSNDRPLRFDDQNNYPKIPFDDSNIRPQDSNDSPLTFNDPDNQDINHNGGQVTFQDDNNVEYQGNKKRKRRRRRRKPKNGVLPNHQGFKGRPGLPGPVQDFGAFGYGNPGYPGVRPFRRPRQPRPSLASAALSSITGALTSIAQYDDYQCVPRLLCEAAAGGTLGNGVLDSVAGLQPLLTLLSVYNGISASPLFVFGRAVFLGMTSKGNTGTCRYAYPQCPTDPEQLIHYLNNHNGGFFRFFSAPKLQNQGVNQFYNQLGQAGQGYGVYQPGQQGHGLYPDQNLGEPGYGMYDGQNLGQPSLDNQVRQLNYGLYSQQSQPGFNQNFGNRRPNSYNQNYGSNYAYDYNTYGSENFRLKDSNRIEKRIQNKPTQNDFDDDFETNNNKIKWLFPGDVTSNKYDQELKIRDSRTLKFPEASQNQNVQEDYNRKGKVINFPGSQNNQNNYNYHHHTQTSSYNFNNNYPTTTSNYDKFTNQNYYNRQNLYTNYNDYNNYRYTTTTMPNYSHIQNNPNYYNNRQNYFTNNYHKYPTTTFNHDEYVFDYKHNFYVKKEKHSYNQHNNNVNYNKNYDDGSKTVYVVRGNGDPNNPEIVKLRPGQSVH